MSIYVSLLYLYIKLNNKRHFFIETDDHSRVILETEHDYINANYIDVSMTCVKSLLLKFFFFVKVKRKY